MWTWWMCKLWLLTANKKDRETRPQQPLKGGNERRISPMAGRGGSQWSPANTYTTWQQNWRAQPSSASIQLSKMEPTQQSPQQQHRRSASVHSRRSSTTRDIWPAWQCIHTTTFQYTQPPYICKNTNSTPYGCKHSILHAYTTHTLSIFQNWRNLLTVWSCSMRPATCMEATNVLTLTLFSIHVCMCEVTLHPTVWNALLNKWWRCTLK